MEAVEDMMANVDLRAEPGLSLTLVPTMSGSQVAMSSASLPPSGMTEATSNASSQITGQAYVSGASVDVLYVEKIQNLQPCCLAFFPTFRHHFVVGTYSLEDATTQSRTGSLLLYLIQDDKLLQLDTYVHSSAILDIKFRNPKYQEPERFAIASSTGSISFFKSELAQDHGFKGKIVHLDTFQVFSESIVITSLAWHSSWNGAIAVTSSDGLVSILNFRNNYTELHHTAAVHFHGSDEAWTVAFGMDADHLHAGDREYRTMMAKTKPKQHQFKRLLSKYQGVFSGGDDSRLRFAGFSRSKGGNTMRYHEPTDRYGKGKGLGGHNAGVTAILPLPLPTGMGDDILITGSYDDHVRVYAMYDHNPCTAGSEPKVLAELNLGGGVWRLALLEDYAQKDSYGDWVYIKGSIEPVTFKVLASCMQAGVRVLEITGCLKGTWAIKVIADLKFNTGNDLVYGGDVQPAGNHRSSGLEDEYVFVSANFYEQQLCLWKYAKLVDPPSPRTVYLTNRRHEFEPKPARLSEIWSYF